MIKTKVFFSFINFFFTIIIYSQSIKLDGLIKAKDDVEGIHVINKTSQKFTVTNNKGSFVIQAKLNDTIVFSSIQYKLQAIIISKQIIETKTLVVNLIESVNELDEVIVGKVLTGDLDFDINNSDLERPINFYDVGIPGFTGKPKTQSERRLYEADHGKYINSFSGGFGLGLGINLNKILNRVTGRTKMLKQRVKLETEEKLMYGIKARLSEDFFSENPLDKKLHIAFFYFCSEDKYFSKRCLDKSDIEVFKFLKEKYLDYKNNLNEIRD